MLLSGAVKTLAANRVLFGLGYLLAPKRTARGWVGKAGEGKASTVLTRALGARDFALGIGALVADRTRRCPWPSSEGRRLAVGRIGHRRIAWVHEDAVVSIAG